MKQVLDNAIVEAAEILMRNFGQVSEYTVKESQSSIVTATDVESEKKIMEVISATYPSHNLLGEETGFKNNNSEYTWVVDPIDGTSNFTAGIPWFGILICVFKGFKPQMSVCYLPYQELKYSAEKGRGAWLNGNPISVSGEKELENILMAYSLDFSHDEEKTKNEVQLMEKLVRSVRNIRSTNCLVDFCLTANGKLGACANQTTGIWDIAAPTLLIEEAGGVVSDMKGDPIDFTFTKDNYLRNFEIVASNKTLHPKLIELINNQ